MLNQRALHGDYRRVKRRNVSCDKAVNTEGYRLEEPDWWKNCIGGTTGLIHWTNHEVEELDCWKDWTDASVWKNQTGGIITRLMESRTGGRNIGLVEEILDWWKNRTDASVWKNQTGGIITRLMESRTGGRNIRLVEETDWCQCLEEPDLWNN